MYLKNTLRLACLFFTILYFFAGIVVPVFAQVAYTYDQNGNMTSDGTNCYSYNDANELSQVKNCSTNQIIAQYVYDYQGNRIEKRVYNNGTLQKTVYAPNDGYETDKLASNSATTNTTYYQVNNENVAQKNPDGTKNYYLTDNLGSTSVITNQSGNVVESSTYYPFGQIRSGGTQSKFMYTGQENDPETNLDYYNARYYNPGNMHFTQPDTYTADIYNPQDLNSYSYVLNNPLTYTDPTGHAFSDDKTGGIAGTGAIPLFNPVADAFDRGDYLNAAWNGSNFVPGVGPDKFIIVGLASKVLEAGSDTSKVVDASKPIAEDLERAYGPAHNAANAEKLKTALTYQEMMTEDGVAIAGTSDTPTFRDASKIALSRGGNPSDWVKMSSRTSLSKNNGTVVQMHWVENIKTGVRTFFKQKIMLRKK